MAAPTRYHDSDLTDEEWEILDPLLPPAPTGGRPRDYDMRAVFNGMFYILRTGCPWRYLPKYYPPPGVVYYYFRQFRRDGTLERIHDALRKRVRLKEEKNRAASAAIIDSQSVKTTDRGGVRGYDAGKKVKGRKRHILVDTLGLLICVVVHGADIQDRDGAKLVLENLRHRHSKIQKVFADSGYQGELVEWVKELRYYMNVSLEIVKRSDAAKGKFVVLPKRWIVERTFAWMGKCRRLSKDYEFLVESSEAMIRLAMTRMMLHRLTE